MQDKEAARLGCLEMHTTTKLKKKKNQNEQIQNTTRFLNAILWSLEETEFCLQFHPSVPEVNKKEKFMFLLKAMLSVQ